MVSLQILLESFALRTWQSEKQNLCPISFLPDEILYQIFSFVEKSSWLSVLIVCKWWHIVGKLVFDPSIKDQSALKWSCEKGKLECVQSLLAGKNSSELKSHSEFLDPRVDVAIDDQWCLKIVCQHGHLQILQYLLKDSRVDVSSSGHMAFRKAYDQSSIQRNF